MRGYQPLESHRLRAVALASGVAALAATFTTVLNRGDHAIFFDTTYIAAYRLLNQILPEKYGVETSLVDTPDPQNVRDAIRPNTKLVHIETPANPTLKELTDQIRFTYQVNCGGIISPFNAWLINHGSVTLPLRMRQHNASAQAIAEHLQSLPQVRFVAYPGLESHPHHAFAASQLARPDAGFGGVLAFGLNTDHDGHNRFVSKLNVITSAVSLGHDESLIVFLGEDDERQYLYPPEFHQGFFRLAVGLEDTDDLIRDIGHALS